MKRFVKGFSMALGGIALSAASLSAQITNTGLNILGGLDQSWKLSVTQLLPGELGTTYTIPAAYTGGGSFATVETTIPSPPWGPNKPGTYMWIGATSNATIPNNGASPLGDGLRRFRYMYTTVIGSNSNGFSGFLGWDNYLVGYSINGGANNPFLPSTSFDQSGYCRSDGEFAAGAFPNCFTPFTIANTLVAGQTFSITIEGDGKTDGLLVASVPEPSTYLLMGAGLLGVGFMSRRRRTIA